MDAPCVVALIAVTVPDHAFIPLSEQMISVGAAMQNFLIAVHAAGFAGTVLSGKRVGTRSLRCALGLRANEELVGFIVIGTPVDQPKPKPDIEVTDHLSIW